MKPIHSSEVAERVSYHRTTLQCLKDFSKWSSFGGVPAFFPAMEMLSIGSTLNYMAQQHVN